MKNRQSGFNLVELMIVMVVISILAAILIPSFIGWRHDANMTKARIETGILGAAVRIFIRESDDGYYPSYFPADPADSPYHGADLNNTYYTNLLAEDVGVEDVFTDPWANATSPTMVVGTVTRRTYRYSVVPVGAGGIAAVTGFVIWSQGPNGATNWTYDATGVRPVINLNTAAGGDDIVASNLSVVP